MSVDLWLGLGLGVALGLGYMASSWWTFRRALRSERQFMLFALGGMMVRMFAALVLVALVLALAPVRPSAFVGGFFFVFTFGLVVEIAWLHRRASARSSDSHRG